MNAAIPSAVAFEMLLSKKRRKLYERECSYETASATDIGSTS